MVIIDAISRTLRNITRLSHRCRPLRLIVKGSAFFYVLVSSKGLGLDELLCGPTLNRLVTICWEAKMRTTHDTARRVPICSSVCQDVIRTPSPVSAHFPHQSTIPFVREKRSIIRAHASLHTFSVQLPNLMRHTTHENMITQQKPFLNHSRPFAAAVYL